MSECSHDCSSCKKECGQRGIEKEKQNEKSNIKKIIGIMSGKGGVGKSLVTAMLAGEAKRHGFSVAVLDADITGPSAARLFGIKQRANSDGKYLYPIESENGVKVMSINLLLQGEEDPVIWRAPIISGTVKQFYSGVAWSNVDYMFVDMPPGTGDVPLTIFQSLPINGIVTVTSPQELVSMIVGKAVKMADMMNIPLLALVENMSYFKCTNCGTQTEIFGKSKIAETAKHFGINNYFRLPIDPTFAQLADEGKISEKQVAEIKELFEKIK